MNPSTAHTSQPYVKPVVGAREPGANWLRSGSRKAWVGLSAAWAAFVGLLPHILHHVGPLAGAAVFAGATGSLLFGVLGLVVAIPFLRRMYRKFGTWRAPAIALALFAAAFSLSTFVIGPAINGEGGDSSARPAPGHEVHHE